MKRRDFLASGVAAGTALVAGCLGGGSVKAQETSQVTWNSFAFEPQYIRVDTETTVTWVNDDSYNHRVIAVSDNWNMDTNVPGGEKATFTFEREGVYTAECDEHGARMKIAVGDAEIKDQVES